MKLYSMTATFGKLEQATLTLEPGYNVIYAPNEWGKSTWCAFIVAMFYGIDTRERSKQNLLADKERYAPWSGSPMAGRVDLCWQGRDITIERSTKGRTVFGQFRAYETETGMDIPELTGSNCGQMLLGVEKSVFLRAGFLRQAELPVGQDEALRRRLNALVTTADERDTGDKLAQKLRELKNQCRSNRTNGLIPKAEAKKEELEQRLSRYQMLADQLARSEEQQRALSKKLAELENHQQALRYLDYENYAKRLEAAREEARRGEERVKSLEGRCAALPQEGALDQTLSHIQRLRQEQESLQLDLQLLSPPEEAPQVPEAFRDLSTEDGIRQAKTDQTVLAAALKERGAWLGGLLGTVLVLAGLALAPAVYWPLLALSLIGGGVLWSWAAHRRRARATAQALEEKYGPVEPQDWVQAAEAWTRSQEAFSQRQQAYKKSRTELDKRARQLQDEIRALAGTQSLSGLEQGCKQAQQTHREMADARRELARAAALVQTLLEARTEVTPPRQPDSLRLSAAETGEQLLQLGQEQQQLNLLQVQLRTRMEGLGPKQTLLDQLEEVGLRLEKLEDTYAALELAQAAVARAEGELQRRFAPRIARRAKTIFAKLTGDRYDRLILTQDLSVLAAAEGETTLQPSLWRSDGTVDQIYFALRLAVAEELTPEAPLILDDALVRFDDTRMVAALEILKQYAQKKQILLFTCQKREQEYQFKEDQI